MRYRRQPIPTPPGRRRRNAPSWEPEGWGSWTGGDFLDGLDDDDGFPTAPDGGPVDYDQFRTGLTFADVAAALDAEARARLDATGERMFVTRSTILGRWHQLKRESYRAYLQEHARR